ncbi:hypothetical protein [Blastopirellula marina]|uniref:hypothetical protein n=1 Tax=Blastopirellula marina TaxID=124 RepID=UPI00103FE34F|nr:hypothetical protein [Blastopirellula marina]
MLTSLSAVSHGENLSLLYVPTSGHIELQAASGIRIDNVNVKTFDDVLALRDKLNDGPLDVNSVTSWKFLKRAGLERVEPTLPPPPPGIKIESIRRVPAWKEVELDFSGSLLQFTKETPDGNLWWKVTVGPKSCVRIDRRGDRVVYQHFSYLSSLPETGLTCRNIFSREEGLLQGSGNFKPHGELEIFTDTIEGRSGSDNIFLVDRKRDAILAHAKYFPNSYYAPSAEHVYAFAIHLQMRSQSLPRPHQIPSLTMRFYRGGRGWYCDCYWIEKADFDIDIPTERFVVNVPALQPYHALGEHPPISRAHVIPDITTKAPATILHELGVK